MGAGLHAARATGDQCDREGGKLYPDRIGGEVVARGLREKPCCSFFWFFDWLLVQGVPGADNYYTRGDGVFFLFPNFSVSFSLFLRCCCCAILCFLVRTYQAHTAYQKKKISTLLGVCTYVRTTCDSWHYQVANFQLQHSSTFCPPRIFDVLFLPERSEAPCI